MSYWDITHPPEDIDVETTTEDIIKRTGITLEEG